jgi:hypothetical protein
MRGIELPGRVEDDPLRVAFRCHSPRHDAVFGAEALGSLLGEGGRLSRGADDVPVAPGVDLSDIVGAIRRHDYQAGTHLYRHGASSFDCFGGGLRAIGPDDDGLHATDASPALRSARSELATEGGSRPYLVTAYIVEALIRNGEIWTAYRTKHMPPNFDDCAGDRDV